MLFSGVPEISSGGAKRRGGTFRTSHTRRVLIMLIHFETSDVSQDEDRMIDILNRYLKIKNLNKINYEEKN